MTDGPYPDVPDDAEGGDALVRLLSEMDKSHFTKAVMLVGAARREYQLAVDTEDAIDVPFGQFAVETSECWQDALDG